MKILTRKAAADMRKKGVTLGDISEEDRWPDREERREVKEKAEVSVVGVEGNVGTQTRELENKQ